MKFFKTIGQNIYDPLYYRVVRAESTKTSLKYYYKLVLILALVLTILFSIVLIPALIVFSNLIKADGPNWYPADLAVTVKDGKVSTNVTEPYVVPLPASWQQGTSTLLVIDTKNNFSLEQFETYKAPVWLTADSLVYRENKGITIKPLPKELNAVVDRGQVTSWINKLAPWLKVLIPLFILGFFLLVVVAYSAHLLVLLLIALFIILIGRLKQVRLSYGEAYRIAVHASTLPLIFMTASWLLAPFANLHFLPTLILLVVAASNIKVELTVL